MNPVDTAIAAGPDAIRAELDRQETIYARQHSAYLAARSSSRFAHKAQMNKTSRKVARLQQALNGAA